MDLVRRIVLAARDNEVPGQPVGKFDDVDAGTFGEHVQLLVEAGLIGAAVQATQHRVTTALVWRLTWTGHDFAQAIVDDTIWSRAKDNVLKPAGSWTFSVLLEYLKIEIRRHIPGLPS
jgi:hypothetical protein